ncbi:POT family domain-containing protein [Phthorimaea operculella]|nr:POT family domain-containing protein [Phthorimaea operculella]
MSKEVEKGEECPSGPPVKDQFPRIVIVIILTEFCERFSFSGMRAFLTLYLRSKLDYTDDGATEMYHIFSTLIYFFPILGGIIADNYLGKYRTILYLMFVYLAGNLLVAITAIPLLALPGRLCTLIGLFMIAVGTGGIKPCVAAFGGDQFKLPQQEKYLTAYFSILYFTLCIGSLIAKTFSPILRSEIQCFGDKDCYSMAFGAPGFIVLLSIVIFVSARRRYVVKKPEGNIVVDFVKCVTLGIKNALLNRNRTDNVHWLDSTQHQYDKRFIQDVKRTLKIMMLFTVLPVFWALLDQMGSRWTLQATKMRGNFGFFTVKPDQMQVVCPICILILIPLFQKYVYPFLEKRNILKNPLHKLTLGGILAGVAFIASASVEIYLKTTYPHLPEPGYSQLRIFNGNPCPVTVTNQNITYTIPPLFHFTEKNFKVACRRNVNLKINGTCVQEGKKTLVLDENRAISFFLSGNDLYRYKDKVEKSKAGFPVVTILSSHPTNNITLLNKRRNEVELLVDKRIIPHKEVFASTYSLTNGVEIVKDDIELQMGGVYTILMDKVNGTYSANVIVITEPNSITMAWLFPQFLIMSIAEVLFAVTGNEFAFKESPESMKAVISAVWLLTEAVGNIIIIIVTRIFANYPQETQSFIYVGMILVSIAVFHCMSRNYVTSVEDVTPAKRRGSEYLYLQVKQTEDCLDH